MTATHPSREVVRHWVVNGSARRLTFTADARLLDVLRNELGLVGAKEGCGEGECGACSVIVDGTLRLSCLQLAAALPDHTDLLTVEAIVDTPAGRRLVHAMAERGGVQCGFCTPGFVVAGWWYVTTRPPIDAREALSGNLCRCTGYQGIVNAVREVAEDGPPAAETEGRR